MGKRLWWLSRPFVWRWRLRYWDWEASKVALRFAVFGNRAVREAFKSWEAKEDKP